MANKKDVFDMFDRIIYGSILRKPSNDHYAATDQYMTTVGDDKKFNMIIANLAAVDTKTSGLLTHISLIIATLGVLYTTQSANNPFNKVLMCEICLYMLISIFCIRSIRLYIRIDSGIDSNIDIKQIQNDFETEYITRSIAYIFASKSTIILTVLLVLSLFIQLLFGYGHAA